MRGPCVVGLSPKVLQSMLRSVTERLASELGSPAPFAPDWCASEWLMARAAASIHGVTPLLASRLRWAGADSWRQFLREQCVLEQLRHRRIAELLRLIDERLRLAGIPAVALKGAALYEGGFYSTGQRPMADVDILVRTCDLEHVSQALAALGFRETSRFWKNRVFSPSDAASASSPQKPGEHPIRIELHDRIREMLPARMVELSEPVFPAQAEPGLNPYARTSALMAHLLLHASGAIVERVVRLIQLHDIALLAERMTDRDWTEALRMSERHAAFWWAFPPLALAARYYPGRIPEGTLSLARASCPLILRHIASRQRLSDVSLSFPWTQAFPGVAWARSPAEALEYAGRRMRGEEPRARREAASRTEPGLSPHERNWLRASQSARIFRWLVSRPARPETTRAIRLAFGECS